MAALLRSSPEILLDPRLEEGIPLDAPLASEAAPCPAGGQLEVPGSSQSHQHATSAAADTTEAKSPHSTEGGGELPASGAPAASALAQGTGLGHDSFERPALRVPNEYPQPPSQAAHRTEPAPQGDTVGHAVCQELSGATACTSNPLPVESEALTASAPSHDAPGHDHAEGGPVTDPQGGLFTGAASALEALQVRACDWREALMSAPEACARRGSAAALSAVAAQALPAQLGPALLPACASVLQVCGAPGAP